MRKSTSPPRATSTRFGSALSATPCRRCQSTSVRLPAAVPNQVSMRLIGLAVVLALGLALAPLAAEAQQAAKIAQLGYLGTDRAAIPQLLEAFRQGLRDLGYVEGRNLVIEYRYSEGKFERLPALAAELVAVPRQNSVRRQVIDLSALIRRRSRLNGHSSAPPASTPPDALRLPPSGRPGEPGFAPPARRLQEDGEQAEVARQRSTVLGRVGQRVGRLEAGSPHRVTQHRPAVAAPPLPRVLGQTLRARRGGTPAPKPPDQGSRRPHGSGQYSVRRTS